MVTLKTLVFMSYIIQLVAGAPISKRDFGDNVDPKNEILYPNGTVVGKYSYSDEEGNPINVKYYADDSSYGVELNSVKVISPNPTNIAFLPAGTTDKISYLKTMEPLLDLVSDIMRFNPISDKGKENLEDHTEGKLIYPINNPFSGDFDTFYANDVKAPKQCEKNKVRVYLVKDKIRG